MRLSIVAACVAVFGAFAFGAQAQDGPGIMGGMSAPAITKLVNTMLPPIIEQVKHTPFEDISGKQSGFNYEVRNIRITEFSLDSFNLAVQGGVRVDLRGIHGHADMDWKYKLHKWPHVPKGSGRAEATIDVRDIGATFVLGVTGDGRPAISINAVTVEVSSVKIKTHGSIFSWLYNLIIKAFQGKFRKAIESTLKAAIESTFNSKIAEIIATLPMTTRVGRWGTIDLHIPQNGLGYVGQSIVLAFNGEVYPVDSSSDGAVPRHATLPFAASGRLLDLVIDTFVLQTLFHSYHRTGLFNKEISRDKHPDKFPDLFDTAKWTWIPQMAKVYPNHDVRFVVSFDTDPTVAAIPGELKFGAGFLVDVQVAPAGTGSFTTGLVLTAAGSTRIDISLDTATPFNPVLHFSIPDFHPVFKVRDSTIGAIDLTLLNIVVDALLNHVILPGVNAMVADGIPLPTVHGLSISNAEFKVIQNGFEMHADVDFNI